MQKPCSLAGSQILKRICGGEKVVVVLGELVFVVGGSSRRCCRDRNGGGGVGVHQQIVAVVEKGFGFGGRDERDCDCGRGQEWWRQGQ